MGWRECKVLIGDDCVAGQCQLAGKVIEVLIIYRADLAPGAGLVVDGHAVTVAEICNPGLRNENLVLTCVPQVIEQEAAKAAAAPAKRPRKGADRVVAIRAFIVAGLADGRLDLADPLHVDAEGRPDCRALTELMGWRVAEAERNTAWQEIQAERGVV